MHQSGFSRETDPIGHIYTYTCRKTSQYICIIYISIYLPGKIICKYKTKLNFPETCCSSCVNQLRERLHNLRGQPSHTLGVTSFSLSPTLLPLLSCIHDFAFPHCYQLNPLNLCIHIFCLDY